MDIIIPMQPERVLKLGITAQKPMINYLQDIGLAKIYGLGKEALLNQAQKGEKVNTKYNEMKSRGLGDDIEKFTKATGIKTIVDIVSDRLNIPCGCARRRDQLNELIKYKVRNGRKGEKEI